MPLSTDIHQHIPDLTADAVAPADQADLNAQAKNDVKSVTYWFSEESAIAVQREAYGLTTDRPAEVSEGV